MIVDDEGNFWHLTEIYLDGVVMLDIDIDFCSGLLDEGEGSRL